jgi:hypothetical protein
MAFIGVVIENQSLHMRIADIQYQQRGSSKGLMQVIT